jgi:hypothetical protein
MRITIIHEDGAVGVNEDFRLNLDLSQCGLPENFWAFQWNKKGDNTGEIEYNSSTIENDLVTAIPVWANACVAVWQAKLDQEAAEDARAAAEQAQQEA